MSSETLTVNEAVRELNLNGPEVVYRLLRAGVLRGERVGREWKIDAASVADRKSRVAVKRSSRSNARAERERAMEETEAMFA